MPAFKAPNKTNYRGSLADFKQSGLTDISLDDVANSIIGGIRNIMSPWSQTSPGELPQVTQFKSLERQTAQMLDQTITGGMIEAGVKSPKALAKQAALNTAYAAGGYAAGKVAGKAASALVESGLPARLANRIKQETVIVHGTGVPIKGNFLNPKAGSGGAPKTPVVFGLNPSTVDGVTSSRSIGLRFAKESQEANPYNSAGMQLVIGKTKTKNLINLDSVESVAQKAGRKELLVASKEPVAIKQILPYPTEAELSRALKLQGAKVKPSLLEVLASKKEAKVLAKRRRISDKNSPV